MSLTEIKGYTPLIQELSNSLNLEDCITPSLKKVVDHAFKSCVGTWASFNSCFKDILEPLNFSQTPIKSIQIENLKEIFESYASGVMTCPQISAPNDLKLINVVRGPRGIYTQNTLNSIMSAASKALQKGSEGWDVVKNTFISKCPEFTRNYLNIDHLKGLFDQSSFPEIKTPILSPTIEPLTKTSSSTFSAIENFLWKKEVLIISALAVTALVGYKALCGSKKQQKAKVDQSVSSSYKTAKTINTPQTKPSTQQIGTSLRQRVQ